MRTVDRQSRSEQSEVSDTSGRSLRQAAPPGTPTAHRGPWCAYCFNDQQRHSNVTFRWAAAKNSGALPITGYEVQYQRDDDNDRQ